MPAIKNILLSHCFSVLKVVDLIFNWTTQSSSIVILFYMQQSIFVINIHLSGYVNARQQVWSITFFFLERTSYVTSSTSFVFICDRSFYRCDHQAIKTKGIRSAWKFWLILNCAKPKLVNSMGFLGNKNRKPRDIFKSQYKVRFKMNINLLYLNWFSIIKCIKRNVMNF